MAEVKWRLVTNHWFQVNKRTTLQHQIGASTRPDEKPKYPQTVAT